MLGNVLLLLVGLLFIADWGYTIFFAPRCPNCRSAIWFMSGDCRRCEFWGTRR